MISASKKLLVVVLALVLIVQFAIGLDDSGRISADEIQPADNDSPGGIIGLFLSPIKATLNLSKRLLSPFGGVRKIIVNGFDELQVQTFKLFMRTYNRTYNSPEELKRRMSIFFENRKMIQQSVIDYTAGKIPFIMSENAFTDRDESELKAMARSIPPKKYEEMTDEERELMWKDSYQLDEDLKMRDEFIGDKSETKNSDLSQLPSPPLDAEPLVSAALYADQDDDDDEEEEDDDDHFDISSQDDSNLTVMAPERIPASKDWRETGCVAKPMDQQACGACYAISTINTLESMRCILNKKSSPILSPQQVIDCSTPRAGYQNFGCDGGWPTRVLKYLQNVKVITRNSCYPFVRRQHTCQLRRVQSTDGCTLRASPTDTRLEYKLLNNEQDILYHVAKTGPVITVMKALNSFLFYSRGIYDENRCSRRRDDVDHAIVIVGYGRENGMDYWLIKNSWGTDWGEGGYGKYRRGARTCSIGSWGWVITS